MESRERKPVVLVADELFVGYGFLGLVKGNRAFLDHIPAALESLRGLVAEIPELARLREALERLS